MEYLLTLTLPLFMVSLFFLFLSQVFSFPLQVLPYPPLCTPPFWLAELTRSCPIPQKEKACSCPILFWLLSCYCSSSTPLPFQWLLTYFLTDSPHSFLLWQFLVTAAWILSIITYFSLSFQVLVIMWQLVKNKGKKIHWVLKRRNTSYLSHQVRVTLKVLEFVLSTGVPTPRQFWVLAYFFNIMIIIAGSGLPLPKSTPKGVPCIWRKASDIYLR